MRKFLHVNTKIIREVEDDNTFLPIYEKSPSWEEVGKEEKATKSTTKKTNKAKA